MKPQRAQRRVGDGGRATAIPLYGRCAAQKGCCLDDLGNRAVAVSHGCPIHSPGGHARVGFEDNVFLSKGVLAKSNAELVEKAVRLAAEFGREIAAPEETRKVLGIANK